MESNYKPNQSRNEIIPQGLVDLHCITKPLLMGKKSVRVIKKTINPVRAAVRALAYCGTNR
ncbi:hypothetical protein GCM10028807_58040 [Spirosoma daeguense]